VLNEVDVGTPDWIELYNSENHAVTMTDWRLLVYRADDTLAYVYVFPSLAMQPHTYLVLHEGSGSNGTLDLYTGDSSAIHWGNDSSGAAALADDLGLGIDSCRWNTSSVAPPYGTDWTGDNPSAPAVGLTLGRDALSTDTDHGSDWTAQMPSPGRQNLGERTCFDLTLLASPSAGGGVDAYPAPGCSDGHYGSGTRVTLSAHCTAGYAFDHWSGAVSGSNPVTTLGMEGDASVTAHFLTLPTYRVLLPNVLRDHSMAGPGLEATPEGTATPMPTRTAVPTPTVIATPRPEQQWLINPGFELDNGWDIPRTVYPAGFSSTHSHRGLRSMRLGIATEHNVYSYSSAQQTVEIPADATQATLTFYYYPVGAWPDADRIYFCVLRASDDFALRTTVWSDFEAGWHQRSVDLRYYAGQRIKVHFGVKNDGLAGATAVYLDDVELGVQR
jgi:hypothetical protein